MMNNEENSDDEQIIGREDLETGPYTFSHEELDGLPMPIQDEDFDNEETMVPISSSDEEPDLNKMISNGKNLDGLKLAKGKGGSDKAINIRKGITIEKNLKMKSDGKGGMKPEQEFDII